MKRRVQRLSAARCAAGLVIGLLAACSSGDGPPPGDAQPDASVAADQAAPVPDSLRLPWSFTVEDPDGKPIAALTLRFTDEAATSCLGGEWQRAEVTRFQSLGTPAFPGNHPLSWRMDGKDLVIGRNEVCDAYLMFSGELKPGGLEGEFYAWGFSGRQPLGRVRGAPLGAQP